MFCLLRFLGPRRSVFWVFSFLAAPLPRAAARAPTATTTRPTTTAAPATKDRGLQVGKRLLEGARFEESGL